MRQCDSLKERTGAPNFTHVSGTLYRLRLLAARNPDRISPETPPFQQFLNKCNTASYSTPPPLPAFNVKLTDCQHLRRNNCGSCYTVATSHPNRKSTYSKNREPRQLSRFLVQVTAWIPEQSWFDYREGRTYSTNSGVRPAVYSVSNKIQFIGGKAAGA